MEIAPNRILSSPTVLTLPIEAKYVAHGGCMALSWLLLSPLGVAIARYLKPQGAIAQRFALSKTLWFRAHFWLQMGALALTATGVGLAIGAVESNRHFKTRHAQMGITLFILAVAQTLLGVLRPKHQKRNGNRGLFPRCAAAPMRTVWEGLHRLFGYGLIALGMAASVLGADQMKGHIDRAGGDGKVVRHSPWAPWLPDP